MNITDYRLSNTKTETRKKSQRKAKKAKGENKHLKAKSHTNDYKAPNGLNRTTLCTRMTSLPSRWKLFPDTQLFMFTTYTDFNSITHNDFNTHHPIYCEWRYFIWKSSFSLGFASVRSTWYVVVSFLLLFTFTAAVCVRSVYQLLYTHTHTVIKWLLR